MQRELTPVENAGVRGVVIFRKFLPALKAFLYIRIMYQSRRGMVMAEVTGVLVLVWVRSHSCLGLGWSHLDHTSILTL